MVSGSLDVAERKGGIVLARLVGGRGRDLSVAGDGPVHAVTATPLTKLYGRLPQGN